MAPPLDLDELVEHFTLLPDESALLRNKTGATRLGFATLLKHLIWRGRFPRGRSDLPDEAVEFIAKQVKVPAADIAFYDRDGRQIKAHRRELREALGWRPCSVPDAEKLTAWLAEHVCTQERRANQVRLELLTRCRGEQIEPPATYRIDTIVGSALRQGEQLPGPGSLLTGGFGDPAEVLACPAQPAHEPTEKGIVRRAAGPVRGGCAGRSR